jgi:hypothetical protein
MKVSSHPKTNVILLDCPDFLTVEVQTLLKESPQDSLGIEITRIQTDKILSDECSARSKLTEQLREKIQKESSNYLILGRNMRKYQCTPHKMFLASANPIFRIEDILQFADGGCLCEMKGHVTGILIYTYQKDDYVNFYKDVKRTLVRLRTELGHDNVIIVDTSLVFRRPQGLGVFERPTGESVDPMPVATEGQLKLYAQIVSRMAAEFLDAGTSRLSVRYLDKSHLRFNKFLAILNEHSSSLPPIGFKVGTTSFYVDEFDMYLVDAPYAHYFDLQNKYIIENKLTDLFFAPNNPNSQKGKSTYKEGLNYWYFTCQLNSEDDSKIYIKDLVEFESKDDWEAAFGDGSPDQAISKEESAIRAVIVRDWRCTTPELLSPIREEGFFREWVRIIHSAIFYYDDKKLVENDQWAISDGNEFKKKLSKEPSSGGEILEVLYLFGHLDFDGKGLNGGFNFTLFRETNECDLLIKEGLNKVHDAAVQAYVIRRPSLTSKAKELLVPYLIDILEQKALESAISQVFARNYAHNIGSHVDNRTSMAQIRQRIYDLYKVANPNASETDQSKKNELTIIDPKNTDLPIVAWLSYMKDVLARYKTERNEFLADFTLPARTVSFFNQVIMPFCENTLLLDHIALSEGVGYSDKNSNRLSIRTFIHGHELKACYEDLRSYEGDGDICYPDKFPYLTITNGKETSLGDAFNSRKIVGEDIQVSLPSEHAFYSILENFIRNSAKHNSAEVRVHGLTVYVSIVDCDDDHCWAYLYDNVSARPPGVIWDLIERKRKDLLDKRTSTFNRENLGMADMKINAHLLASADDITEEALNRALEIVVLPNVESKPQGELLHLPPKELPSDPLPKHESLDSFRSDLEKQPIQAVRQQKAEPGEKSEPCYRFGYRFKLSKAKRVCWIGRSAQNDVENSLAKEGIVFFENKDEFLRPSGRSVSSWQFAVLEKSVFDKWNKPAHGKEPELRNAFESMMKALPGRVLVNSDKNDNWPAGGTLLHEYKEQRRFQTDVISTNGCTKSDEPWHFVMRQCWENWLHWFPYGKGKLMVDNTTLFDSCESSPLVLWSHHGEGLPDCKDVHFGDRNAFVEYGKSNPDFGLIVACKEKKFFNYELLEAGRLRILVLDERITEIGLSRSFRWENSKGRDPLHEMGFLYTGDFRDTHTFDTLWAANVCVVTHLEDTELAKFGSQHQHSCKLKFELPDTTKGLKLFMGGSRNSNGSEEAYREITSGDFDVVVIHRTYLSSSYEGKILCGLGTEEFLNHLRKVIPHVVLCSGGAYPHGIQGHFKFSSYQAISSCINGGRGIGKLSLVKGLMQL